MKFAIVWRIIERKIHKDQSWNRSKAIEEQNRKRKPRRGGVSWWCWANHNELNLLIALRNFRTSPTISYSAKTLLNDHFLRRKHTECENDLIFAAQLDSRRTRRFNQHSLIFITTLMMNHQLNERNLKQQRRVPCCDLLSIVTDDCIDNNLRLNWFRIVFNLHLNSVQSNENESWFMNLFRSCLLLFASKLLGFSFETETFGD
jgi:hypothetical protein